MGSSAAGTPRLRDPSLPATLLVGVTAVGVVLLPLAMMVRTAYQEGSGDLANVLRADSLPFHPFDTWSDIARILLERGA